MVLPVQQLNANTWLRLGQLAANENGQSANTGGDPLPSIAPSGNAWAEFKSNPALHTPHIAQLNSSVQGIHKFIAEHAPAGAGRHEALGNLQHYANAKINCPTDNLSALTVNENRRNLHLFAQQLHNPAIPTDQKLAAVRGPVRSLLTLLIVFSSMLVAGASGVIPSGLSLPGSSSGWAALASLVVLYGLAFTLLFVCVPRLNMAQNAPVMNVEPIATLLLGWALLDQQLGTLQLLGGAVVVCGIVLLTYRRAN